MRAIAFTRHGAPPTIHNLPEPAPAPGEVLVEVSASSVNGFDFGVLSGGLKGVYEYEFPVVLGKDFAGRIVGLGEGADGFALGQRVFGVVMRATLGQGGFAPYLAVPAAMGIGAVPDELGDEAAGALSLSATAALGAVDAIDPRAGEMVVVSGATGGVGTIAVQLAAARGAHVLATARPGKEADYVLSLGAAHAVDFTDLEGGVRELAPGGVSAAVHLAGDGAAVAGLLEAGGRFATTVHYVPEREDITATAVMAHPDRSTLERLAADVVAGRLRLRVTSYPMEDFETAFADFRAGTLGKLGVRI